MNLLTDKKTGIVYPEASKCEGSITEAYMMKDYGGLPSLLDFDGSVIMDCGANIGSFAKRAAEEGARRIEAYEPFPGCVECLKQNVGHFESVNVRQVAVSSAEDAGKPLTFYYKEGNLEASTLDKPVASQMTRWNFQTLEVETVDFWKEVVHLQPSIVKMDIEGEEWRILRAGTFPDHVRFLAVEFHRIIKNSDDGQWSGVLSLLNKTFGGSTTVTERLCKSFGRHNQGTIVLSR
jgi:FkbM family methyltransferase